MDHANIHILGSSNAQAKLLLDANVFSYAEDAFRATGVHLLEFLESMKGTIDWFVANSVAMNLYNSGIVPGIMTNLLNSNDPRVKMDHFPYLKADGSLGFVRLNKLASDDWAQITLAYNHEDLIIVTNDSKMFKTAHAITGGRAMPFHYFLREFGRNWAGNDDWERLERWFHANVEPLRNNSSWILPEDARG